jgi:hypothetical protein
MLGASSARALFFEIFSIMDNPIERKVNIFDSNLCFKFLLGLGLGNSR